MRLNKDWMFLAPPFCLGCLNLLFAVYWLSHTLRLEIVYSYQGHDYPPNLPLPIPLSTTLLTVEESQSYALAGLDSDEEWAALGGLAFGYVRLPTPYGQRRMFVTTMFHELHCLRLLNLAFDESHIISDHHIAHCLNYLRQMSLCDADLTLEYAGWEESARTEGATHVCRDWTHVYEFVDANWQEWKDVAASQDK